MLNVIQYEMATGGGNLPVACTPEAPDVKWHTGYLKPR